MIGETVPIDWNLPVGTRLRRSQVHDRYDGQRQGGISTPRSSQDVLIFTEPERGRRFGYDKFEGLREDGSYAYTGEGQVGDQQFIRGNRALLNSAKKLGLVRVFRTRGPFATYVGSFALDDTVPFEWRQIPDRNGEQRKGIIFNLVPVQADTSLLPAFGGENPAFDQGPLEDQTHEEPLIHRLKLAYVRWLRATGATVSRLSMPLEGALIRPDVFDETNKELVAVKRSTSRGIVRAALGQVLDYVHVASMHGIFASPAVVLPAPPSADILELFSQHRVRVRVPDNEALLSFSELTSKRDSPNA